MKHSILCVESLTIRSKASKEVLVNNLEFRLEPSKSLTLLGQSGSGKTMTCRAILGLLNRQIFSTTGSIVFDGTDLSRLKEKDRKQVYGSQIAFVPQNPMTALDPSRKVGHQMTAFLRGHQSLKKDDALELYASALIEAGLKEPDRILASLPGQLSGGMLQRALIALAIASKSKLVIADEPTTALDAIHRDQAVEQLCYLQKRGCAVLLITHDFNVARQMSGDILILKEGHAVEGGPIQNILSSPKADYTKELIAAVHLDWRR